ncbi:MAG: serine hydrolase [Fimbriimonadia bacterium]|nr:serine hydrolase [Fimbriimonadia bacterium]
MKPLSALKDELDAICLQFNGVMGYSLTHATFEERIDLLGDEIFPTASTIKVAVMGKAFEEIMAGRLGYYETLPVTLRDLRGGSGLLQFYRAGSEVSVKELIHLMITVSDNTATIMLARKLGTVNINDWLFRQGTKETRLLALRPDEDAELVALCNQWGLGMTTPNDMVTLLNAIRVGKAGTPAACDEMLRILSHQFYDDLIAAQCPPEVTVCSKSGSINQTRADVGIVFSPSGPYMLATFTKEALDTRWTPDNEGQLAIKALSRAVWNHYHPTHPWRIPEENHSLYPPAE